MNLMDFTGSKREAKYAGIIVAKKTSTIVMQEMRIIYSGCNKIGTVFT